MPEESLDAPPAMEKVATPGVRTIADLMAFFDIAEDRFLKTVAYEADGELVLASIRGDYEVSETKLTNHLKAIKLQMATEETLTARGLYGGFLSPVGLKNVRLILDTSVGDHALYVAGGNEPDVHLRNVMLGRDLAAGERIDIAEVRHGDPCAGCDGGTLEIKRGIELGHTFKLGVKYTAPDTMDVTFLDASGAQERVIMGCYGIGVERLMAAAVEQWHDASGMIFPVTLAPFQVILTALGQKEAVVDTAESIYEELRDRCEVLFDDRDESPGVKLKDADLLGIPIRVVVSQKLAKNDQVEIKVRRTGEVTLCGRDELVSLLPKLLEDLKPSLDGLPFMPE
jgi:prolyl-tRNA synthetase